MLWLDQITRKPRETFTQRENRPVFRSPIEQPNFAPQAKPSLKKTTNIFSRMWETIKQGFNNIFLNNIQNFLKAIGFLPKLKVIAAFQDIKQTKDQFVQLVRDKFPLNRKMTEMQSAEHLLKVANNYQEANKVLAEINPDQKAMLYRLGQDSYLREAPYFPVNGGELCCARTVSYLLGLDETKSAGVMRLVPQLIKANLEASGGVDTGVRPTDGPLLAGDVCMFLGREGDSRAGHRYSHVGVIVETGIEIGGQEFIAMAHDGSRLEIVLYPKHRNASAQQEARSLLAQIHNNPGQREEIFKKYPKLKPLYEARANVNDKNKSKYFRVVDKNSQGKPVYSFQPEDSTIQFVVRTANLKRKGLANS